MPPARAGHHQRWETGIVVAEAPQSYRLGGWRQNGDAEKIVAFCYVPGTIRNEVKLEARSTPKLSFSRSLPQGSSQSHHRHWRWAPDFVSAHHQQSQFSDLHRRRERTHAICLQSARGGNNGNFSSQTKTACEENARVFHPLSHRCLEALCELKDGHPARSRRLGEDAHTCSFPHQRYARLISAPSKLAGDRDCKLT